MENERIVREIYEVKELGKETGKLPKSIIDEVRKVEDISRGDILRLVQDRAKWKKITQLPTLIKHVTNY